MGWGERRWATGGASPLRLVHWAEADGSFRALSRSECQRIAARLSRGHRPLARRIVSVLRSSEVRDAEGLERELTELLWEGWLLLQDDRPRRRTLNQPGEAAPPPKAPGPASTPEAPGWMEVRVTDELGVGVGGTSVLIEADGSAPLTTDPAGTIRLDPVNASIGHASLPDLEAVREILRPRWDLVRAEPWLEPDALDHSFFAVREEVSVGDTVLRERPQTLVLQPWVVRARFDGFLFDTNKCFLLPAAVATTAGLHAPIHALRRWLDEHAAATALVVGHTDTSGEPWYNDPLSVERAESFIAFLRQDPDPWLAWYGLDRAAEKRWGAHEDQLMLDAVATSWGLAPVPDLTRAYQTQRGLTADGIVGPLTRAKLVPDYMGLQDGSLALPAALTPHGCGESFPRTDKPDVAGVDGAPIAGDDAAQRRVEVFLFDAAMGVQPPPPGPVSPAGSTSYPEWVRRARRTRQFSIARTHMFELRVLNTALEPLPDARVRLEDPNVEIEADDRGIALIPFREGQRSRSVVWSPKDDPLLEYRTELFLEFEDDDEGLHRKLRNLGCDDVATFQREFGRPVTGHPDDVRADVHDWHDHGPPPASDATLVAFQPGGGPGVSPTQGGGPSRGTVAPKGLNALVVGVLVGGKAPTSSDTLTIELTATAPATVGKPPVSSMTASANASGSARFEHLTQGTFRLVVHVERTHAGGTFVGREEQTIVVHHRGGEDHTNVRIPLVTIRNKAGTAPPLTLLERGKTRAVFAQVATNDPVALQWSGGAGLSIDGSTSANPATLSGSSASPSVGASLLSARQRRGPGPLANTAASTMALVERRGTATLPMTVAQLKGVTFRMTATPPLTPRPFLSASDRKSSVHEASSTLTAPDYGDSDKILYMLRGADHDAELVPQVSPAGAPVKWDIDRNPDDHGSLGSGEPTLNGTPTRADLKLDATGSFFVFAHLDLPSSEQPTPRGMALVLAELRDARDADHLADPSKWKATHDTTGDSFGLTSCPLSSTPPELTPTRTAMRARATVTVVSGGKHGRMGLDGQSGGILSRVQLGWVNNVLSSRMRIDYSTNGPVEVKYTEKSGSGSDGRFLPADPAPALVAHPITDSNHVSLGGHEAALSLRDMAMTPASPIGMDVVVTSLDAPSLEAPEKYAAMAETNAVGRVSAIEVTHAFRCFLCGWTMNPSFGGASGVVATPGRHTFIATAKFDWGLSGRGKYTISSAALDGTPVTTVGQTSFLTPTEAHLADCEVREPGSLECARPVVS